MANILILTSFYLQKDSVLSNNVSKIVVELCKNNQVVCISEELEAKENFDVKNLRVITTQATSLTKKILLKKSKKYIWINRIKSALMWWAYPNTDMKSTRRKEKMAIEELKQTEYDLIISFYRQYSNIQAMCNVKRKYPNVKVVAVFLDLLEAYVPFGFTQSMFTRKCRRIEKRLLDICDLCLFPANYERQVFAKFEEKLANKIRIFDYPLYHYYERKSEIQQGKIHLLYAGTVNEQYRNPLIFLNMLNELGTVCEHFKVSLYVTGDCVQKILELSKTTKYELNVNGLISHDDLITKMDEADILVNINNNNQIAVPSKIFEIASFGKPIINYSFSENDYANVYFEKYPIALVLKDWEPTEIQQSDLGMFIMSARDNYVSKAELDHIFKKNTSEFFVSLLQPLLCVEAKNV